MPLAYGECASRRHTGSTGEYAQPPAIKSPGYGWPGLSWLGGIRYAHRDGEDLRGRPLEDRKAALADLLRGVRDGIAFNRHYEGDGAIIFKYGDRGDRHRINLLHCDRHKRRRPRHVKSSAWYATRGRALMIASHRFSNDQRFHHQ